MLYLSLSFKKSFLSNPYAFFANEKIKKQLEIKYNVKIHGRF